jgi:NADH-quinone oxidoreductase subunit C
MADGEVAPAVTGALASVPGEENSSFVALRETFPDLPLRAGSMRGQDWAIVPALALVDVCLFLRDDPRTQYKMLLDVTAVDLLPRAPRWEVVYSLLSLGRNARYRVKVEVEDGPDPAVSTVSMVWPTANFFEREIFDLMGLRFIDHPDLRRLLLPDDWVGYPLRFDHPLGGEEVGFTS